MHHRNSASILTAELQTILHCSIHIFPLILLLILSSLTASPRSTRFRTLASHHVRPFSAGPRATAVSLVMEQLTERGKVHHQLCTNESKSLPIFPQTSHLHQISHQSKLAYQMESVILSTEWPKSNYAIAGRPPTCLLTN